MLHITPVPLKKGDNLREENFFCGRTPACQIRLPSRFELDMTASQNGSQFTYPNENPPFKLNESNEALHKSTNPAAHTIPKVKSSLVPSALSVSLHLHAVSHSSSFLVFASLFLHQPWQLHNLSQSDLSRPSVPAEFIGGRKRMRTCHSSSTNPLTPSASVSHALYRVHSLACIPSLHIYIPAVCMQHVCTVNYKHKI